MVVFRLIASIIVASLTLAMPALARQTGTQPTGTTLAGSTTTIHAQTPNISCPGDKVVWVNMRSGAIHHEGDKFYGKTKHGKFECERDAGKAVHKTTAGG